MIIDGRAIADRRIAHMRAFILGRAIEPVLLAYTMEPNSATLQYLKIKRKIAERIGIRMVIETLPVGTAADAVVSHIEGQLASIHGVVLQLPFPKELDLSILLGSLPSAYDPDRMGDAAHREIREGNTAALSPVVSAIRLLLSQEGISVTGQHVVVVGQGRLVGIPATEWFLKNGARVTRLTRDSGLDPGIIKTADSIVLGAGVPGLLTPSMLKSGVVIFDAGTSEEGGRVVGDADPRCSEKARLFTPVPGGIGPIAVAELFSNMLILQFGYEPSSL